MRARWRDTLILLHVFAWASLMSRRLTLTAIANALGGLCSMCMLLEVLLQPLCAVEGSCTEAPFAEAVGESVVQTVLQRSVSCE